MDAEGAASNCSGKNHFREAIVLATKVVNAPGIIAELCLSDDPDYLVGYLASLKHGYVRLMPMKEMGNPHGGRVFIFDSTKAKAEDAINYLEKQRVLVRGLPVEKPANPNPEQIFADELKQLKEQNLYRSLRTMDSEQRNTLKCRDARFLMLASNSYLDLAADTRVKQAAAEAALQWGAGQRRQPSDYRQYRTARSTRKQAGTVQGYGSSISIQHRLHGQRRHYFRPLQQ